MILKSIHLPLFILSFLFIGCLGVEKSSEVETSSSDTITTESDSTNITVRVLLGTIAIDSIHVTVSVDSSTQTLPISYGSQIDGEASFSFSIPSSSGSFEVFYQCYRLGTIIGSKKESLELPGDTEVTSTIDAYPVTITTYNDTTIEIGDKLTLNPDVNDDSDNITTTYDFFGTGDFSSGYSAYFDDVGEFTVTVKAFDGYHTISVTFVITVVDPAVATPVGSSSSIDDPLVYSSSSAISSGTTLSSTSFSSSFSTPLSSTPFISSNSAPINSSSATLSSSSQLSSVTQTSSSLENSSTLSSSSLLSSVESSSSAPRLYNISITTNGSCGSVTNSNGYTYSEGSGSLAILNTMESYCSVQFTSNDVNFLDNEITGLTPSGLVKTESTIDITVTFSDVAIPSANISVECYLENTKQSSCTGEFGTVTPSSFTLYENDNSQTIVCNPGTGFDCSGFSVITNTSLASTNTNSTVVSYINENTNGSVRVDFSRERYDISLTTTSGGTISKDNDTIVHGIEKDISVTATSNSNHYFNSWVGKNGCTVKSQIPLRVICTANGSVEAEFIGIRVTSVSTIPSKNIVLYSSTATLTPIIEPSNAANKSVYWASLNTSVATVSTSEGVVTAQNIGTVLIVATTNDGSHKDTTTVTINSFMDGRDSTVYDASKIGTQIWMAENLNYNVYDSRSSWCYGGDSNKCNAYGRLYHWATAMSGHDYPYSSSGSGVPGSSANPSNIKGICPTGWHLPSRSEWNDLISYVDSDNPIYYLKNNANNTGLSVKLGGQYGSGAGYLGAGSSESWWASDSYQGYRAYSVYFSSTINVSNDLNHSNEYNRNYVRCVKD